MKPWAVIALRVAMFVGILWSIHSQHRKFLKQQSLAANWSDVMPWIREVLSQAESVRADSETALAVVLDRDGNELGSVVHTVPMANHILGFSGPTDVLLIFDPSSSVVAAKIISSRDTRDHVQQVLNDPKFLLSLNGRSRKELLDLDDVDAVSGATLTSYAILESIRFRLTNADPSGPETRRRGSLKFPNPPRLEDVRLLYGNASMVERNPESTILWKVSDAGGQEVGQLLRASPVADNIVGFQGPTDALIAFDDTGEVTGIALGFSYDNEPYAGYVREDWYFRNLFNDRDVQALAALDSGTVEGVSGATMTSQAVARSLQITAQAYVDEQLNHRTGLQIRSEMAGRGRGRLESRLAESQVFEFPKLLTLRNLSTIIVTLLGVVLGLTHLRGRRWLRVAYQVIVIGWLGLINGDLVSQALLLGWAQSGIPWQNALGLTFLTAAALLVPITTGRNVYCSHICPHGAVQQLVRRRLPWQLKRSGSVTRWLKWIPLMLCAWVVTIGLLHLPFSPVDIEPFDAWIWSIAGLAAIMIAIIGLVASLFVPMAYCRFGCPTGAVLNYLGNSCGRSWNRRDTSTAVMLIVALIVSFVL